MMRYLFALLFFSATVFAQEDTVSSFNGIKLVFHSNGGIKKRMTYKNGIVNGLVTTYNDRGKMVEEGTWYRKKWIGNYKLFYENGHMQQNFFFDEKGKRTGLQRFYYPNGIIQYIMKIINEKENGYALEFNMDGSLKKKPEYYLNGQKTDIENSGMLQLMMDIVKKENETVSNK